MRSFPLAVVLLLVVLSLSAAASEPTVVVQGGAVLGATSPIVKILREGHAFDSLEEGNILYVFTERGEPVTQITVKNVFSDEIHSEPIPEAVASRMRSESTILIFSNVQEYGDFIKAYLVGTEEVFRKFISSHPDSLLRKEAQKVVDGIIYRPYKLKGTAEALEEFLAKYPDNAYRENALFRRDSLQFKPFQEADLLTEYRRFMLLYPGNRFVVQARQRVADILSSFQEVSIDHLAKASSSLVGQKVKFFGHLHSILPIYVSGTSVGKKTEKFTSPRSGEDYLNIQVEGAGFILWKLFIERDQADLVRRIQTLERRRLVRIFGQVFSNDGNSPWIDVYDIEADQD